MSNLVVCPDCKGEGFWLVRNRASIHYVSAPDALYDALPCERCDGTGEIDCPHEGALMNPTPAVKQGDHVLRWRCTCVECGEAVVIDADTGENAGQDAGDVFKHGPNLPAA